MRINWRKKCRMTQSACSYGANLLLAPHNSLHSIRLLLEYVRLHRATPSKASILIFRNTWSPSTHESAYFYEFHQGNFLCRFRTSGVSQFEFIAFHILYLIQKENCISRTTPWIAKPQSRWWVSCRHILNLDGTLEFLQYGWTETKTSVKFEWTSLWKTSKDKKSQTLCFVWTR